MTEDRSVTEMLRRKPKLFLCHASEDSARVVALHEELARDGFEPWIDKFNIVAGTHWREEIEASMRASDLILICLSTQSIKKEGVVNWEIEEAILIAREKVRHVPFLVSVRLEEFDLPGWLSGRQWVDLYRIGGYQKLVQAVLSRCRFLGLTADSSAPEPDALPRPDTGLTGEVRVGLGPCDLDPIMVNVPPEAPQFRMSAYLITNRQFVAFLADDINGDWRPGGSCSVNRFVDRFYLTHWQHGSPSAEQWDQPVVNVSCHAVRAFSAWIGAKLGIPLILPEPGQWRLAAVAGRETMDSWWKQDVAEGRVAFYDTSNALTEAGAFRSSRYGLFDMIGNVRDMCFDRERSQTLACGGYYRSKEDQLSQIVAIEPDECRPDTGFRVAGAPELEIHA